MREVVFVAQIIRGDCVEVMARMEAGSVDAVVCDPPYEINFMAREWDRRGVAFDPKTWAAVLRVLKPGGYLLAFGGTRTCHRMTCAIEDAGFEIRDRILVAKQQGGGLVEVDHPTELAWLYGSGFPKSLDVSKAIDKRRDDIDEVRVVCRWLRAAIDSSAETLGTVAKRFEFHPRMVEHWAARDTDSQPTLPTLEQWDVLRDLLGFGDEMDSEVLRLNIRKGEPGEAWAERPVTGEVEEWENRSNYALTSRDGLRRDEAVTEDAKRWEGWGTALKPAHEPIVVARKPLGERNVAANVLKHGTGGLNVDAARIAGPEGESPAAKRRATSTAPVAPGSYEKEASGQLTNRMTEERYREERPGEQLGRWPANVVLVHPPDCALIGTKQVRAITGTSSGDPDGHGIYGTGFPRGDKAKLGKGDEDGMETVEEWECVEGCPIRELDAQSGQRTSGKVVTRGITVAGYKGMVFGAESRSAGPVEWYGDTGGASRFFYTAKAARGDREAGLLGVVPCARCGGLDTVEHEIEGAPGVCIRNDHPTVKPIDVMRWLVRLVTPPDGVVLDPFTGSGTTGIACELEGFAFVGVEQGERNAQIAEARVAFWREHGEDGLVTIRAQEALERRGVERREELESAGQSSLFD